MLKMRLRKRVVRVWEHNGQFKVLDRHGNHLTPTTAEIETIRRNLTSYNSLTLLEKFQEHIRHESSRAVRRRLQGIYTDALNTAQEIAMEAGAKAFKQYVEALQDHATGVIGEFLNDLME
jgi:hypothetical protein